MKPAVAVGMAVTGPPRTDPHMQELLHTALPLDATPRGIGSNRVARSALGLRRACRRWLAISSPPAWPSRGKHSVGARYSSFEARFLARRCLCLHFTLRLMALSVRLEVKMGRFSASGQFLLLPQAKLSGRFQRLPEIPEQILDVFQPR